jgi:hypothetical protein
MFRGQRSEHAEREGASPFSAKAANIRGLLYDANDASLCALIYL